MDNRFKEGGLEHDGGTKDPVSGNDVPIGSTQKEVRDDIPAQLSEGEYVIPADVVRFFGVKFFEELRMKAKDGMELLQAKGQMGNGDEQYVDDDVPFDMEDLDLDFNEGGVVYANKGTFASKDVSEASKYMSGIKTADQSALDMYDINKDGKIDISDTVGIGKLVQEQEDARKKASVDALKMSAGITKDPSQEQITKLDTNYDGKINIQDVTGNLTGKLDDNNNAAPGTGGSGVPPANFNYQYTNNDAHQASKYAIGLKQTDQAALDLYDLNKDGKIDVSDQVAIAKRAQEQEEERKKQAVEALKIDVGITKNPTDEQMSRLDLNNDGKITIGDVVENAGGTRQPDPIDDKEEDPVDIQTQKVFTELPYNSGVSQEEKDARQRYSFEELMGGYTKPSDFKKGAFAKALDEAKDKAKEEETPVDDRTEETDIGGEGGFDGTESMSDAEIADANYASHLQTMQAIPETANFISGLIPGPAGQVASVLGAISDAHTLSQQSELAGINMSFTDALETSLGNLMESLGLSTNPDGLTSMAQEIEAAYGMQDITGPVTTPTMGYYNPALNPFAPIPEGQENAGMPQGGYSTTTGHFVDPVTGNISAVGPAKALDALLEIDPKAVLAVADARKKNPFTPKFAYVNPKTVKKAQEKVAQQEAAGKAAQSVSQSTGINVEPEQVEGVMNDNPGMTAEEAAQAVVDAISAEAAMTGNDPNAPSPSTDAIGGYGDEGLDTPDPSTDAIGGYGDEGLDSPDSDPESESDPDPDDENKGGFITKRKASGKLKPKYKKRKGLAARK